jgi:hypothetical protein
MTENTAASEHQSVKEVRRVADHFAGNNSGEIRQGLEQGKITLGGLVLEFRRELERHFGQDEPKNGVAQEPAADTYTDDYRDTY